MQQDEKRPVFKRDSSFTLVPSWFLVPGSGGLEAGNECGSWSKWSPLSGASYCPILFDSNFTSFSGLIDKRNLKIFLFFRI